MSLKYEPASVPQVIRPEKGFCVKIATTDTGAKIFVNLCGTDRVPEPSQGDAKAGTNYDTTGSKVILAKSRPSLTLSLPPSPSLPRSLSIPLIVPLP